MIDKARIALRDVFGFDDFKPMQAEVIRNILLRKDTLAVMPTGGGKSLCYQLPALLFDGLTVVVSPLISLMKDQVDQLTALGVPVCMLNSSLMADVYRGNVEKIQQNKAKLLYISPESLLKVNVMELLSRVKIDCLAIDEAHCISFWGHEFRPEYRQLVDVRKHFADTVCVALTATATPRVRTDIMECLGFSEKNQYIAGFNRENLFLAVTAKENAWEQVVDFIEQFPDESGIIYCFTRKQVDVLAERLSAEGFSVVPYHAGLTDAQREYNQEQFIRDDAKIAVATIAFGMGIDKPNIRFVLHFDLPKTLEHYYQEIGRAGRDGLPARCLLLFGYGDLVKIRSVIDKIRDKAEWRAARLQLGEMIRYAESRDCRRIPLLSYFGDPYGQRGCGMCDNCRTDRKPGVEITIPAQKFLACVKRTGEKFGGKHVIDVLRGSKGEKVLRFGHDRLSTYGIGMDLSRKQWLQLSRELLHQGLMSQDMEYGSLSVTERGMTVLRGKEKVLGHLEAEKLEIPREKVEPEEYDTNLFRRLKILRKSIADAENVPPYVIFPDKTLLQMSSFFPRSPAGLAGIHGVGKVKLETFGVKFLEEIRTYCLEHGITEIPMKNLKPVSRDTGNISGKKRFQEVGDAFCRGKTVPELMSIYNIKEPTILGHLYDFLKDGNGIDPERFNRISEISDQDQKNVMDAFDKMGESMLRPVFEFFDGRIGYNDLHRIRLRYLSLKGPEHLRPLDDEKKIQQTGKTIVCLANSRKYAGCCIAGKEFTQGTAGDWVRPVSSSETGELDPNCAVMRGWGPPKLLDIFEISVICHDPKGCQTENYRVSGHPWKKVGTFSKERLHRLCDSPDTLWINGWQSLTGINDRIPVNFADETLGSSLCMIKPENLSIIIEEGPRKLKRVRAEFTYRSILYRWVVTDPVIERRYINKALGRYPIGKDDLFLTASISEPYQEYCYKLVASLPGADLGE